jgi:hypothetical protein
MTYTSTDFVLGGLAGVAAFYNDGNWETVIKDSCYEKVHHSCSIALRRGDGAGLLHERTPDNDDHNASDHSDYGITA